MTKDTFTLPELERAFLLYRMVQRQLCRECYTLIGKALTGRATKRELMTRSTHVGAGRCTSRELAQILFLSPRAKMLPLESRAPFEVCEQYQACIKPNDVLDLALELLLLDHRSLQPR